MFGLRSTEDVRRVKMSETHFFDWPNGWHSTKFLGGRAKLCGVKKGTRDWRVWRSCQCPGKHHVRPPTTFFTEIQKDGNARCEVKWCTVCPVAALEFLFTLQEPEWEPKRCYAKWLASGRMGRSNISDVAGLAVDWFVSQGVVTEENRYSRNAGRKSLARWCDHLNVPYNESFQVHGDLFEVWAKNYEQGVAKSGFKGRKQSTDPQVATKALRKFANLLGRGRRVKPKLALETRFQSDSRRQI